MRKRSKSGKISVLVAAGALLASSMLVRAQTIDEFPLDNAASSPRSIVAGPDGNLWFTESAAGAIGRITPAGNVTEFPVPDAGSQPWRIAVGPDGAMWFTELLGNRIGRITVGGQIEEFPVPTPNSLPTGIASGPDGAMWFTEREGNKIGRITTGGAIVEFPLSSHTGPNGIVAGPDGALWFAEEYAGRAGRITTAGAWTETAVLAEGTYPTGVASVASGTVWVTTSPSGFAIRIPVAGGNPAARSVTAYALGDPAADGSGNIWYPVSDGKIGRLDTHNQLAAFTIPTEGAFPAGVAVAPDGKIWFTESQTGKIGRLDPATASTACVAPGAPALAVDGAGSTGVSAGGPFVLTWTDPLGSSPGSFTVLRSDGGGLGFVPVSTTSQTSVKLTAAASDAGKTLFFEVRATRECATSNATGPTSNTVSVIVAGAPPPPPPPPPPPEGCTPVPGERPCRIAPVTTAPLEPIDRSR